MTLDLLINQVLEKDAACFLLCETQSIEAGAAKTWGGWIPTSTCWQHRTPQSKHWITEAEQWSRGPTWMTLTQLNLLSVWSNFHKYWAKGYCILIVKYMTMTSVSANTQHHWMPPNCHRGLCHTQALLLPAVSAPPLSQNLPALPHILGPWPALWLSLKCGDYLEGSGCTHRLQGRTSSPLLIQQPVQSNSNKSLPFP